MAVGLAAVVDDLTVVVNVGDDAEMYGALVCADLDTVLYTLAGIQGPEGWGVEGDTFVVMDHLAAMGVNTAFRLGDRDLAHCLARTEFLAAGGSLSEFTAAAAARLGVDTTTVLPASDDPIRTKIETAEGAVLDFQDYFVVRRQSDRVAAVHYAGAASAEPAPGVIDAIDAADIVVIAPSNPPLSIAPILAMPKLLAAVKRHPLVVAVSPLIGGAAVKGPLVAVMDGLGVSPNNAGIAWMYRDLDLAGIVIDTSDASDAPDLDVPVIVAPTLMGEPAAAAELARSILDTTV